MLKISPALESLINANWMLRFGLHHNIFNLTRLAKFIHPMIQTRTKKDVSQQALLMALSRYQQSHRKKDSSKHHFTVKNISLQSGLATLTYSANPTIADHIYKLHSEIQKNEGYFTLSEGTDEITLIIKKESMGLAKKIIGEKAKYEKENLAAIGIKFDSSYSERPGFLYYIIQFISLQGINIHEISSTFTEVVIYVAEKDIRLAFDTMLDTLNQE
jgi:aspartokinase